MPLLILLIMLFFLLFLRSLRLRLGRRLRLVLDLLMHLGLRLWLRRPLHLLGLWLRLSMHLWRRLVRHLLLMLWGRLRHELPRRPALGSGYRGGCRRSRRTVLHLPLSGVLSRGDAGLRGLLMLTPGTGLWFPGLEPLPRWRYSLGWSGSHGGRTFRDGNSPLAPHGFLRSNWLPGGNGLRCSLMAAPIGDRPRRGAQGPRSGAGQF